MSTENIDLTITRDQVVLQSTSCFGLPEGRLGNRWCRFFYHCIPPLGHHIYVKKQERILAPHGLKKRLLELFTKFFGDRYREDEPEMNREGCA